MSNLYAELVGAAASREVAGLGDLFLRAYAEGWETGDIYEALGEGGLDLGFGDIERIAQRAAFA